MFNQSVGERSPSSANIEMSVVERDLSRYSVSKPYQLDQSRVTDKAYVLSQVSQNGLLLAQAPYEIRNDAEVVRAAVNENGWLIGYAAPDLHDNKPPI